MPHQADDDVHEDILYKCAACGWLSAERGSIDSPFVWCCECDEWAEQKPIIYRKTI